MAKFKQQLKTELEFYNKNKKKWLGQYLGKFLLIKGKKLLGAYKSYEKAISIGYELVGIDKPFFVRQLEINDPIFFI